jgi:hypothetical protein
MEPVKTFISYSHADEAFKDELVTALSPLKRAKQIDIWDDRAILVGNKWDEEIKKALAQCEMAIFLLSPDFLASDYVNDVEITGAMQRHQENRIRLVFVMIRNCDVNSHVIPGQRYRLKDFQGLPKNFKAVNSWTLREEAWMNVVQGIKPVINVIQSERKDKTGNN